MSKIAIVSAALLTVGIIGCGSKSEPVTVTPEIEAKQQEQEKLVYDVESARQKQEKPARTREQNVQAAELERQRQNGR